MAVKLPTLDEMVKAGVHFGHKKQRSFSKALKYTYTVRDGIYIIDLEKTQDKLTSACEYLSKMSQEGKTILFVGTKKQAKKIVEEAAKRVEMPYVTVRWLGGTLTNFETVRKSIKHLNELEAMKKAEDYKGLTKKERLGLDEKIAKLHNTFDGILTMDKMPDVMFVVDAEEENIAISEAIKKNIPVVAICDTNANPDKVTYPIPANDDAAKSIEMIVTLTTDAIEEGKNKVK